jgi:hypothetical protein
MAIAVARSRCGVVLGKRMRVTMILLVRLLLAVPRARLVLVHRTLLSGL